MTTSLIDHAESLDTLEAKLSADSKPCVFSCIPQEWYPLSDWAPASVSSRFGHRMLPLSRAVEGCFGYEVKANFSESPAAFPIFPATLATAVSKISSNKDKARYAVRTASISQLIPEMMREISVPPAISGLAHLELFYLGGSNTRSALHFDRTNNLIIQLRGEKRWKMIAPEHLPSLPHYPSYCSALNGSPLDLYDSDSERDPHVHDVPVLDFTLKAGQALLVPAFWYHQVMNLADCVSVHFSWKPSIEQSLLPPSRRLLSSDFWHDHLMKLDLDLQTEGYPGLAWYSEQVRLKGDRQGTALIELAILRKVLLKTARLIHRFPSTLRLSELLQIVSEHLSFEEDLQMALVEKVALANAVDQREYSDRDLNILDSLREEIARVEQLARSQVPA